MIGELTSRQILALSRDGISAEEISKSLDVDIGIVKLALATNGSGSAADRDINDEQLGMLRERAFSLAMTSEDDSVAARMTMFLIERDKPKVEQVSSPIININQAILQAHESYQKLISEYTEVQTNGAS